jgi:hypothetical protein
VVLMFSGSKIIFTIGDLLSNNPKLTYIQLQGNKLNAATFWYLAKLDINLDNQRSVTCLITLLRCSHFHFVMFIFSKTNYFRDFTVQFSCYINGRTTVNVD